MWLWVGGPMYLQIRCVCVKERERESERERVGGNVFIHLIQNCLVFLELAILLSTCRYLPKSIDGLTQTDTQYHTSTHVYID